MNNVTTVLPEYLIDTPRSYTINRVFSFLFLLFTFHFPVFLISLITHWKLILTSILICFVIPFFLYIIHTFLKRNVLSQYKNLNESNLINNDNIIKNKNHQIPNNNDLFTTDGFNNNTKRQEKFENESNTHQTIWEQIISAIRIFGYLDNHVVKELINNMYTRKVDSGDMIVLNDNLGLIVVLDGSFHVYHNISSAASTSTSFPSPFPTNSDILSPTGLKENFFSEFSVDGNITLEETEYDPLNTDYIWLKNGLGKFQLLNIIKKGNPISSLIDILKLFTSNVGPILESPPTLIARASVESTIAVIPSHAFKRLLSKYPKDASHLIQTVLNRLYHVNFQITNSYLGLTNELFQIEKSLNSKKNIQLPYYLLKNVIQGFNPSSQRQTSVPLSLNQSNDSFDFNHKILNDQDIDTVNCNQVTQNNSLIYNSASAYSTIKKESNDIDDSVLKMALVDIIFKFWGITKENFMLSNYSYNSNPSSRSSSVVGLTPTDLNIIPSSAVVIKKNRYPRTSLLSTSFDTTTSPLETNLRTSSSSLSLSSHKSKHPRNVTIQKSMDYYSARKDFAQCVDIKFYPNGTTIVKQNSDSQGLFYLLSGKIDVTVYSTTSSQVSQESKLNNPETEESITEHLIYTVESGGIAGYLSSLVGYRSFVNLIAQTDCYVAIISNEMLEILYDKYYSINLRIVESLINNLSIKMWKLDHALEWIHINASDILFQQGDPANGIYVILNGRLRQYQSSMKSESFHLSQNGVTKVIGELAQGESFGEVEVLTAMNRSSTIVAVRDSELARLSRSLFELLATEHPSILIRVSRMIVRKLLDINQHNVTNIGMSSSVSSIATMTSPSIKSLIDMGHKNDNCLPSSSENSIFHHHHHNSSSLVSPLSSQLYPRNITYRTITILPITNGLPVESFAMRLIQAFKQVGKKTIGLTQRTTLLHLGRHAFDKLFKLKQSGYFSDLERTYNIVVYIADTAVNSSWTKTCIDQGDCILLLADAKLSCQIGEYERLLLRSKTSARAELILLHGERYVEPGLTRKWLSNRPWVDSHHHIQFDTGLLAKDVTRNERWLNANGISLLDKITQTELGRRAYNISKLLPDSIKNTVGIFTSRLMRARKHPYNPIHFHKNDFIRLARLLSGQAIGLVLGGGGARGISHLGILQALEEQGIPIDIIGGTSIGSFIGGIYAKDYDIVPIYGRIKKFAGRISSLWRMLSDLTWPVTSYTTGHEFNRGIWKTFGDTRIEDFWIQYYCNSTNITESVQEIHSSGYAWRYIRASMSLAGLLPPLEDNGSMLLDGGYVDNLPVDEMKVRGCKTIFAVDVGSVDDRTPMNYGDSLNGFWIVFNRWNPFSSHPNIPNMAEIQMRLGYVASVNALEKAKHTPGVIYVRPPIDDYNTLDFAKFEEIYQVGVNYGREFFQHLIENNRMPYIPGSKETTSGVMDPVSLLYRRNSM